MAGGIFRDRGSACGRDFDHSAVRLVTVIAYAKALVRIKAGNDEARATIGEVVGQVDGAGQRVLAAEGFVHAQHRTGPIDHDPAGAPGTPAAGAGIKGVAGATDRDVGPTLDRFTAGEGEISHELIGLTADTVVLNKANEARGGQAHQNASDDHRDNQLDQCEAGITPDGNERSISTDER